MKLIPRYAVLYKGVWYSAGDTIVILPSDEDELRQHGEIIKDDETTKPEEKKSSKSVSHNKKN